MRERYLVKKAEGEGVSLAVYKRRMIKKGASR